MISYYNSYYIVNTYSLLKTYMIEYLEFFIKKVIKKIIFENNFYI